MASFMPSLIREMHALKRRSTLDLGLGEPRIPVPEDLFNEAIQEFRESSAGYTPNEGLFDLREAIAAHAGCGRRNAHQVVVTAGSAGALASTLGALIDTGVEVLLPDPAYPAYADLIRLFGGQPRAVDLGNAGQDFVDRLVEALTPQTRGVVICSPVNPTGQVLSRDTLEALAAMAEKHGLWVVSDEIYRDLVDSPPAPSLVEATDQGIVVGGLSKSVSMTGFRLGWTLLPRHLVEPVVQVHRLTVTCAPHLSQLLALRVLADTDRIAAFADTYRTRRQRAAEAAQSMDLIHTKPEGAFYLWIDLRPQVDDTVVFTRRLLSKHDVLVIPGEAFGPQSAGHVRISCAVEPDILREGLTRMVSFLDENAG
jgi:aminotransferase